VYDVDVSQHSRRPSLSFYFLLRNIVTELGELDIGIFLVVHDQELLDEDRTGWELTDRTSRS
jgi:hypothetical protein